MHEYIHKVFGGIIQRQYREKLKTIYISTDRGMII